MTPIPRRNLALFTFGAAALLTGCEREEAAATSGSTTAPSPYQTAAAAPAPGAPVEPAN